MLRLSTNFFLFIFLLAVLSLPSFWSLSFVHFPPAPDPGLVLGSRTAQNVSLKAEPYPSGQRLSLVVSVFPDQKTVYHGFASVKNEFSGIKNFLIEDIRLGENGDFVQGYDVFFGRVGEKIDAGREITLRPGEEVPLNLEITGGRGGRPFFPVGLGLVIRTLN